MENFSYTSYPDSANSSPHSRDVDENQSFDEPPPPATTASKVKLMCSYGGKIQPRPHDNQLAYMGGDTKILAVDRNIKFSNFINKLTSLCNSNIDNNISCFKYQLPGEDLDALISVTNDEDLEHMMLEYDRLYRGSAKPARLRLFLFQLNNNNSNKNNNNHQSSSSFGSESDDVVKSDRQWFVDALNSVPVQNNLEQLGNADFLFGSENVVVPVTKFTTDTTSFPDIQRMQIGEKLMTSPPPPPAAQVPMPVLMQVPAPYLQERHVSYAIPETFYQVPYQHQQTPTTTTTLRPVSGQVAQGCYGIMQQQPVYNVAPPPPPPTTATAVASSLQQQQQQQQHHQQGGYLQVGYDSSGRQVYYTTTTAPAQPQQYQALAAAPPQPATVQVGGALNQDGMVQVGGGANVMAPQTSSV